MESIQRDDTTDEVDVKEISAGDQQIDAINKAGVNFECSSFKLYESIRRDAEARKTEVPKKADSAKVVELSRNSGIYMSYESVEREKAIKGEELQLNEFEETVNVTEKGEWTHEEHSPKKDVVAPKNSLFGIDESMKNDEEGTTIGATLPKVKCTKKINITENNESLEILDFMKKNETATEREVLQGVPWAAKQGVMNTVNPTEKSDSLKRIDANSKEKLSPNDRSLSSVEINTRKKSLKKGDFLSSVDAVSKEKFNEKHDSFSSRPIDTRKRVWKTVNTTVPGDVITKKEELETDDSVSITYSVPKKGVFRKDSSPSEVSTTTNEKSSRKDDSSSVEDDRSSDYSTRRRDVSSGEES
ncbi:hypothetical protein C922_05048 [Plasmodium inui San Antonio 1]|uniref:Uncharacterized protein n=1 Tax=Plasmodium inui San Antonio 1 TaxID=1237626 RepID=W6ZUZ3_9APIC|nr:hypothetical protein C922_05048 [Plasmodium inui San Antonio 1]EUD64577.1 hypothetical protein C922_05048 [Plasmodium inui San Antonio 1]